MLALAAAAAAAGCVDASMGRPHPSVWQQYRGFCRFSSSSGASQHSAKPVGIV